MPTVDSSSFGFAELDDISAAAYRQAVEIGLFDHDRIASRLTLSVEETSKAAEILRQLNLLQPMPGDPAVLVPVGPDVAAADLVSPAEQEISDLQHAVTRVRSQLLTLMPVYFEGRRMRNQLEAFDVIADGAMVQSMIDEVGKHCNQEVLTVQPGGARPSHVLSSAREVTRQYLERDVRVRTIYQHTARNDLATRSYVREVSGQGAEIRTAEQLIDRMLIYDREIAFLPQRSDCGRRPGAAVVREPTLVAFLCSVFEFMWDGADPFVVDTSKAPSNDDEVKRAILRLMVNGYKDEMVARRLGMAVRTCRRHIAEITEELEAASRFQAGYNAAMMNALRDPLDAE